MSRRRWNSAQLAEKRRDYSMTGKYGRYTDDHGKSETFSIALYDIDRKKGCRNFRCPHQTGSNHHHHHPDFFFQSARAALCGSANRKGVTWVVDPSAQLHVESHVSLVYTRMVTMSLPLQIALPTK